jgi:D-alanyl-D-alanine carboxypeptidase/D-alanyl-D-alanine endopeptidase (penicillin-binding protein 7)
MVLLNAGASSVRVLDALNIRRYVLGDSTPMATSVRAGGPRIRASGLRAMIAHGQATRT